MLLSQNEEEGAIKYLIKAAEQYKSGFAYWEAATSYKKVGEYFKGKDRKKAREYLEKARQCFTLAGEEKNGEEVEEELNGLS